MPRKCLPSPRDRADHADGRDDATGGVAHGRRHRDAAERALLDVLRPAALGDPAQLVEQHALVGDGVRGEARRLPADQSGLEDLRREVREQNLPGAGGVRRQPVPGAAEDPYGPRALQPLDVDHVELIQHPHLHALPRRLPQGGQYGKGRLVQVEVREHRDAQLVHLQPEAVRAVIPALEQALLGEGGEQAVDGADPEPEPARQLGDPELPVGAGEGLQHSRRIADRRQPTARIRRGHSERLATLSAIRDEVVASGTGRVLASIAPHLAPRPRAVSRPAADVICSARSECPWQ